MGDALELIGIISNILGLKDGLEDFVSVWKQRKEADGQRQAEKTIRVALNRKLTESDAKEKLSHLLSKHAATLQPGASLFPLEWRKQFRDEVARNKELLPYCSELNDLVNFYLDEVDKALQSCLTDGERILFREAKDHDAATKEGFQSVHRKLVQIEETLSGSGNSHQSSGLYTSNGWFIDNFTDPLFLHRSGFYRNEKVNLLHLFIPHRFHANQCGKSYQKKEIESYLSRFIHDDERDSPLFLFIEGDGGAGKSSLTSFLCYHWEQGDETGRQIFGDRRLTAIRLRDVEEISDTISPPERLLRALLRFLFPDGTMDNREDQERIRRFRTLEPLVLLLDGFDELCAVPALSDPKIALDAVKGLTALQCKIIITTRPHYLKIGGSTMPYDLIVLQHFNNDQRNEWIRRYETICGERLDDRKRAYLKRLNTAGQSDNRAGICDTPMGLYMVVAGHFDSDVLENEWALYYQIFHREMLDRAYHDPDGFSAIHPVGEDNWEYLYRFSEEAAWRLWQNGNKDLIIRDGEIREIAENIFPDESNARVKETVERCFSICGYWKTDTKRGYAEFYHNKIRDFFVCEKIARDLNGAYRDYAAVLWKALSEDEQKNYNCEAELIPFLELLCAIFQYGKLENGVLRFLRLRFAFLMPGRGPRFPLPDECVTTERDFRPLPRIFQTLLLHGEPYPAKRKVNPVQLVQFIIYNCVSTYRQIYEAFLKEKELIRWWLDDHQANETLSLMNGRIFHNAGSSDLQGADLQGADLRGTVLRGANLQHANLQGAELPGAVLQDAHLQDAHLQHANLWSTDLRGSDLQGADLQGADLRSADLRDADLRGAHLQRADLQGAFLPRADLRGADLQNAYLRGAYLQGADLRGADLRGADLQSADLWGTDLRGADLQGTKIQNANLRGAKLDGCDLSAAIGTLILE